MIVRKVYILEWTELDDKNLFELYKIMGSDWKKITTHFPGKNSNEVKNRFYSTLRRVARKKNPDKRFLPSELIVYIDIAEEEGRTCFCKRGRRRKDNNLPKAKPIRKNKTELREESLSQSKNKEIIQSQFFDIKTEQFSLLNNPKESSDFLYETLKENMYQINDIEYNFNGDQKDLAV